MPQIEIPDLLKLYDVEVRARPRARAGLTVENVDSVLLLAGPSNYVCHWDLPAEDAAHVAARMADRFRGGPESLIWDVHGHDRPSRLGEHLSAAGFVEEHRSTLMLMDLAAGGPSMPDGIKVRRVADPTTLRDFVRVSAEAFGPDANWQFDAFAGQLDSDEDLLFTAYADGQAAGSSRMEIARGSRFAGLFGGAVSPRFQGRGLYRAMVAVRAEAARACDVRYLTTGALQTSRPILERLGFSPVTPITRWVLPHPQQSAQPT